MDNLIQQNKIVLISFPKKKKKKIVLSLLQVFSFLLLRINMQS